MNRLSKKRIILFSVVSFLFLTSICFIIAEITLRVIDIPGINLRPARFNHSVGTGFYPNSPVIYRNERGDYVKKVVNRYGYLDVEHNMKKPNHIFRIGFFGDSYTEAVQVPMDSTFFRLIQNYLTNFGIEIFAFGYSGRSTLDSYLICQQEMFNFDLDMVVYVFVENDIGDQIREIKRNANKPYARIKNGHLIIDSSFRKENSFKETFAYNIYQYICAHSIIVQTIRNRIQLFLEYGIKTKVTKEDRLMTTKSLNSVPNQNDLPSTWPDSLRNYGTMLAGKMILKWRDDVEITDRKFAILYVPRRSEWMKPTNQQDSWKPWLEQFCHQNTISFIDPTHEFFITKKQNKQIYFDHFTNSGHQAFAKAFVNWFNFRKKQLFF